MLKKVERALPLWTVKQTKSGDVQLSCFGINGNKDKAGSETFTGCLTESTAVGGERPEKKLKLQKLMTKLKLPDTYQKRSFQNNT